MLTMPLSSQDLREKNWKAMEALASAEKSCEEKLRSLTQAKVSVGSGLASVKLVSRACSHGQGSPGLRLAPESIQGPSLPLLTCSLPTLPPVSPGEVGSSESFVLLLSWALPSRATGGPSLVCLRGLCLYCSSALTSCLNDPPEHPG